MDSDDKAAASRGSKGGVRTFFVVSAVALFVVTSAACGGSSDSDVAINSDSQAPPIQPGDAATSTLGELRTAIENEGYICTENFAVFSPAISIICLGNGPMAAGYAWETSKVADEYGYNDFSCTPDSPIGEQRYLKDNNWMIKAASLMGATSEHSDEIDGVLSALRVSLGGELDSQQCLSQDQ